MKSDSEDRISVLVGNGDGIFRFRVTYATGNDPNSITVGNFNGDGKSTPAVGNYRDDNVSILLIEG